MSWMNTSFERIEHRFPTKLLREFLSVSTNVLVIIEHALINVPPKRRPSQKIVFLS